MLKMYGPYLRKDGRKHILWYDTITKQKITESYPKYLMEKYLGRKLTKDETVDHINNDFTDNRIENLQILSRRDNIIKSAKKRQMYTFICPVCGKQAVKELNQVKHNRKQHKIGPYCSKSCAGKGSHRNHREDKP